MAAMTTDRSSAAASTSRYTYWLDEGGRVTTLGRPEASSRGARKHSGLTCYFPLFRLRGLRSGLSGSGLSHGSYQEGRRGAVLNRPGQTASQTSWRTVSASGTSAASLTGAGHPATSFGTYLPVIHRPRASCPKGRWRRRR